MIVPPAVPHTTVFVFGPHDACCFFQTGSSRVVVAAYICIVVVGTAAQQVYFPPRTVTIFLIHRQVVSYDTFPVFPPFALPAFCVVPLVSWFFLVPKGARKGNT